MKELLKSIYFKFYINFLCKNVPILKPIYETYDTGNMITLTNWFMQKIVGFNRFVPWPVDFRSIVGGHQYMKIGMNTAPGISFGCYITANRENPIEIGDYTLFAPNVMVLGVNHNLYDLRVSEGKGGIKIGKYCWIGGGSIILSGVELGDHTVVAAGSVVTKSFSDGYCVIAGNPAQLKKVLDREKVINYQEKYLYVGHRKVQ